MNKSDVDRLHKRNRDIIDAVLKKAEKVNPGVIDIIGIAGSFQTGDFYKDSDLDLCIIVNDDEAWKMTSCFIYEFFLGESLSSFDIYSSKWSRMELMLEYKTPYGAKLKELDIVYARNEEVKNRYFELREKFESRLNADLNIEDCDNAEKFLNDALLNYAEIMMSDTAGECRYRASLMTGNIESAIYIYNKKCILGVKRIPEEIVKMSSLPENFTCAYKKIVDAETVEEFKTLSTVLIKGIKAFSEEKRIKKEFTEYKNPDTYEKLHNDISRLNHAYETDNRYLSIKTASEIQDYFDFLYKSYIVEKIDFIKNLDFNDLNSVTMAYKKALDNYKLNYDKNGIKIKKYKTLDEYINDPVI